MQTLTALLSALLICGDQELYGRASSRLAAGLLSTIEAGSAATCSGTIAS